MADKVASYSIAFDGDSSGFDKVVKSVTSSVSAAVADIQRTAGKLDLFGQIADNLPKVQSALDSAKAKVAQLLAEVTKIEATGAKAPKALTDALAQAEKQVATTTKEFARQRQELAALDSQLARAGVNTKNLTAEQQRLATASKAAADAAALQAAKQQLGFVTIKDTTAEANALRAAFDRLKSSGTLSANEIAAAQKQLDTKLKELRGTVTQAGSGIKSFGTEAKSALLGVAGPALAAVGGFASVTAAITASLDAAKQFKNEIGKLGAATNLTKEQLETISQGAKQVARDLGFDVVKAMESVREIVRSGIPADNAIDVLRISAEASKAALVDLSVGVKAAGLLVDAFGLPVHRLGQAFDVLNIAAKSGGFNLQEFAEGAGPILNIARSAGIGLEQLAAALTVITKNGIDSSAAMADLSKFIIALGDEKVRGKLRGLGIESTNLVDVLQQLNAQNLDINGLLELDIASAKSAKSMATLVDNAGQLPGVLTAIVGSAGAVQEATAQLFDTPAERAARFDAALQSAKINLGSTLGVTSQVTQALTVLVNGYNAGAEALKQQGERAALVDQIVVRYIKTLFGLGEATTEAKGRVRDFHEELAVQSAVTVTAVAAVSNAVKSLKELGPELAKLGAALTQSTGGAIAALTEEAQRQIDALDQSIAAQVKTAEEAAAIQAKTAEERLKLIQENEQKVTDAVAAAVTARNQLAERDKEGVVQREAALAKIRIDGLAPVVAQYRQHYEILKGIAARHQADVNAIERQRIDLNEDIDQRIRATRLAGLTDLAQYAEKAKEVDRLIAKAREVASTEGIAAAKKYFDQALQISESIKGEVVSDGTVVVSQFEAQQKSIQKIKDVATAYNDELGKAGEKAKEGADATREQMDSVRETIEELQKQLNALNDIAKSGIQLQVNRDIIGIQEAEDALTKLTRPRTVQVTVQQVGGGQNQGGGSAEDQLRPIFRNRGGFIQHFAGGGSVFKRPAWSKVPGSGNQDTVPAMLNVGSFVMRKAAVEKYGDGIMGMLARGYAKGGFIGGGIERLRLPPELAQDAQRVAAFLEMLPAGVQSRLLDDLDAGGTTAAIARSEIREGVATQARGAPTPIAPGDVSPTPPASIAVEYGRFIESMLKTGGIMALVKQQIGNYINQVNRNPNDQSLIQGLIRSARAAAANNFLENFYGKSVIGGGTQSAFANLPDWYDFIQQFTKSDRPSRNRFRARQFAMGGDVVPAMLTPGEFVLNPRAAASWGANLLHAMNNLKLAPSAVQRGPMKFATGGPVPGASIPSRGTAAIGGIQIDKIEINAAGADPGDPRVLDKFIDGLNNRLRRSGYQLKPT